MDAEVLQIWVMILLYKVGPIVALGGGAYFVLKRTALGRAMLARGDRDTQELHALAGEIDELRHQVLEVQERLDFSERMVAQLTAGVPPREQSTSRTPTPPETAALR